MDTATNPVYITPSESEKFFRKKHTSTIAFAVGILLFFLPFVEIRCNNFPLASNTGFGIAVGKEWKAAMYSELSDLSREARQDKKLEEVKPSTGLNILAIAAFVAALAGLCFAFSNIKLRSMLCMSAGILAAIMLIGLMIQLSIVLKSQLPDKNSGSEYSNFSRATSILLHFTIWYYTSVIAFIAAAFFSFRHHRIEMEDALRGSHQFDFQEKGTFSV